MDGRELVNFKSMLDFDGKVVVVSGGLGLIGVEVCLSLLQHNATVVVADLDKGAFEAKFIVKESKDKVDFFRLDISSPESIESGIETIAEKYKKIDVSCSGIRFVHDSGYGRALALPWSLRRHTGLGQECGITNDWVTNERLKY